MPEKQLSVCLVMQVSVYQIPALMVQIVLAELMTQWEYTSQHFVTTPCFTGKAMNWKMEWKFTLT